MTGENNAQPEDKNKSGSESNQEFTEPAADQDHQADNASDKSSASESVNEPAEGSASAPSGTSKGEPESETSGSETQKDIESEKDFSGSGKKGGFSLKKFCTMLILGIGGALYFLYNDRTQTLESIWGKLNSLSMQKPSAPAQSQADKELKGDVDALKNQISEGLESQQKQMETLHSSVKELTTVASKANNQTLSTGSLDALYGETTVIPKPEPIPDAEESEIALPEGFEAAILTTSPQQEAASAEETLEEIADDQETPSDEASSEEEAHTAEAEFAALPKEAVEKAPASEADVQEESANETAGEETSSEDIPLEKTADKAAQETGDPSAISPLESDEEKTDESDGSDSREEEYSDEPDQDSAEMIAEESSPAGPETSHKAPSAEQAIGHETGHSGSSQGKPLQLSREAKSYVEFVEALLESIFNAIARFFEFLAKLIK